LPNTEIRRRSERVPRQAETTLAQLELARQAGTGRSPASPGPAASRRRCQLARRPDHGLQVFGLLLDVRGVSGSRPASLSERRVPACVPRLQPIAGRARPRPRCSSTASRNSTIRNSADMPGRDEILDAGEIQLAPVTAHTTREQLLLSRGPGMSPLQSR